MTTQAMAADVTDGTTVGVRTARRGKSWGRFGPVVARVVMGLPFLVSGTCGLLLPPIKGGEMAAGAAAFAGALQTTGYMMPLIFVTQLLAGAMLVANRFVALGLVVIAPFLVNSLGFHLFLEHGGLPVIGVFVGLEIYLVWVHRKAYVGMAAVRVAA